MMQRALEESPNRRQPSIDEMLSVLTPFARAWEELGAPPDPPRADIFAEPASARCEPHEAAPMLVEDEASAFASGEEGGRAGELPTPRPSDVPATIKSAPPRDAADSVTDASPVATPRPSETPATLKSAIPPRDARDNVTHAPPVALRSPPAPELPDLEPMLPVPPVPSTPPPSPVLPVPPVPSTPPRSSRTQGRRSPPRWLGAVLALAFVLGGAAAVLWRDRPRHAAPRLGPVLQTAAGRAIRPPSARPIERCPEPPPEAAPPPVAARQRTSRPATPTRQPRKTPAQEPDLCDGLLPCQNVFY
ncbi:MULTISPECIES: hypothetical protein [Sorangium]|nr:MULTISPECIES: hypothetical protein [Sorangium]